MTSKLLEQGKESKRQDIVDNTPNSVIVYSTISSGSGNQYNRFERRRFDLAKKYFCAYKFLELVLMLAMCNDSITNKIHISIQ
eukprot:scaffold119470_cov29-Attheya_sp.AAC.3